LKIEILKKMKLQLIYLNVIILLLIIKHMF